MSRWLEKLLEKSKRNKAKENKMRTVLFKRRYPDILKKYSMIIPDKKFKNDIIKTEIVRKDKYSTRYSVCFEKGQFVWEKETGSIEISGINNFGNKGVGKLLVLAAIDFLKEEKKEFERVKNINLYIEEPEISDFWPRMFGVESREELITLVERNKGRRGKRERHEYIRIPKDFFIDRITDVWD